MKNVDIFCQSQHGLDVHGTYMRCVQGYQGGPRVGFHGGHTITIDKIVPLLNIGEEEEATQDMLSAALYQKCAYICPHLNSASPELFGGRPMTAECPDHTFMEVEARTRFRKVQYCRDQNCYYLRRGEYVTWSQCPHPDCFTRYCLKRMFAVEYGIVLEVSRDLFSDPTHSAWLAQIDQNSAETNIKGVMVNMPKGIALIEIAAVNSPTCKDASQEYEANTNGSKPNGIKEGMYECNTRFEKCYSECVMERCSAFIDYESSAAWP
jgi:hypothetical protein